MASFAAALGFSLFFLPLLAFSLATASVDDEVAMIQISGGTRDVCSDWSDPYETDSIPANRMAHCGADACHWENADMGTQMKDPGALDALMAFMREPAPVRGSLEADIQEFKCNVLDEFKYEFEWFSDGESDSIASVSTGSDAAKFNNQERWRTLGAFYAVFLFTRLAAATNPTELQTYWGQNTPHHGSVPMPGFPVDGVKRMMADVDQGDGLKNLLILTAVHDMFKAVGASGRGESRWSPFEHYRDHDAQLAAVATDTRVGFRGGSAQSKLSAHPIELGDAHHKSLFVLSQQMNLNFGWLVQFEGPPSVVLEAFVSNVQGLASPEEKRKVMQFYFSHFYTDLAGGFQGPNKPPSYKLHFLVAGWLKAGEHLMDLVMLDYSGPADAATQVYNGMLDFQTQGLPPGYEGERVGVKKLLLWAQMKGDDQATQAATMVSAIKGHSNQAGKSLCDLLERSGYDSPMPIVKYVPQWWRKIIEIGAYEEGIQFLSNALEVAIQNFEADDKKEEQNLPDCTRSGGAHDWSNEAVVRDYLKSPNPLDE